MTKDIVTKEEILDILANNPEIAVVGRIRDWLKDSDSRYPVSCTVISVEDSMEGVDGIEYSWNYASKGLRYGSGVSVDLSKLRANGETNEKGLVATGAVGFLSILSRLNEILRRGGTYKNGAVVGFIDAYSGDLPEWIGMSRLEALALQQESPQLFYPYTSFRIPPEKAGYDTNWAKRALYVSDDIYSDEYFLNHPLLEYILRAVRQGVLWLSKKKWDKKGNRIYSVVCLENHLKSKGTCLITPINLGKCTIEHLPTVYKAGMEFLCKLHSITDMKDSYYLTPDEDKQVGLGAIGLSNLLARYQVTYKEFAQCLWDYYDLDYTEFDIRWSEWDTVTQLVESLTDAIEEAAKVARGYGMDRAFSVAPTATVSYQNVDLEGYTTSPEISPPVCHAITKKSVRDSDTFGTKEYQYHPNCETAEEVGWETYYLLCKAWQQMMDYTGLAHGISFNIWQSCPVDKEWVEDWLKSPLTTTYYRFLVDQSYVDKTTINTNGVDLGSEEDDFFVPTEDTESNFNAIIDSFAEENSFSWLREAVKVKEAIDNRPIAEMDLTGFCNFEDGNCTSCSE